MSTCAEFREVETPIEKGDYLFEFIYSNIQTRNTKCTMLYALYITFTTSTWQEVPNTIVDNVPMNGLHVRSKNNKICH